MPRLILRPGRQRRIEAGHPWVFSNEIAEVEGEAVAGDAVEVVDHRGALLGAGYYNPHSLIAARLVARTPVDLDTTAFFRSRLEAALTYRRRLGLDLDCLRLVHGEGDGLPGLVVDRYGPVLSLQLLTAGMDRRRQPLLEALVDLFDPAAVVARNDVRVRRLEGLPLEVEILHGQPPEGVEVNLNGLRFLVDPVAGQKTGHFLDQRDNLRALSGLAAGANVLDLFSYTGSWALHAARYGAESVLGVDVSGKAVATAEDNARRNGLEAACTFLREDAFEFLAGQRRQAKRYDLVVLDPPAFVKSKGKLTEAMRGYLALNRRALEAVAPGGFLATCSCSHHLSRETFLDLLRRAAVQAGRALRLLEFRGQAPDHPVLLSCPETDYLKCALLQVQ